MAISTSKIRKIIETMKNWNEKGRWEGFIILKPHSNCLHDSFFSSLFFFISWIMALMINKIVLAVIHINVIFIIHVIFFLIGN